MSQGDYLIMWTPHTWMMKTKEAERIGLAELLCHVISNGEISASHESIDELVDAIRSLRI